MSRRAGCLPWRSGRDSQCGARAGTQRPPDEAPAFIRELDDAGLLCSGSPSQLAFARSGPGDWNWVFARLEKARCRREPQWCFPLQDRCSITRGATRSYAASLATWCCVEWPGFSGRGGGTLQFGLTNWGRWQERPGRRFRLRRTVSVCSLLLRPRRGQVLTGQGKSRRPERRFLMKRRMPSAVTPHESSSRVAGSGTAVATPLIGTRARSSHGSLNVASASKVTQL